MARNSSKIDKRFMHVVCNVNVKYVYFGAKDIKFRMD